MSAKMRRRVERSIARRFILDAIAAGYKLNVNNGGDENELPAPSNKVKEVLGIMFATDDEYLLVYRNGEKKRFGWVWLVYGNDGPDVISDYSTNLDDVMKGASELADKYSD